jgi:diacylglycerol O-acyltransferase / wax synthase
VVEGVVGDRLALVVKTHHAAVDGVAGFELLSSLIDIGPDAPAPPPPDEPWTPERLPTDVELVAGATAGLVRQPARGWRATQRILQSTVEARWRGGPVRPRVGLGTAPPTPFNGLLGPHRRVRFFDMPLADVKAVKAAADVTVNDVVLAAVSGGLRRYLERHDQLPAQPLVAFVPISARTAGDSSANRTSMVHVPLATDVADPRERLARIAADASAAKAVHGERGPSVLVDISELSGAAMAAVALRIVEATRLNERVRLSGNVVVSNIKGSADPLWTAGARIERIYPIGPLAQGNGLNITLLSYLDALGFSVIADRELVPDLDDLVVDLKTGFVELHAAVTRSNGVARRRRARPVGSAAGSPTE